MRPKYLVVSLASLFMFGCAQQRQPSEKAPVISKKQLPQAQVSNTASKFSDEQTSFSQVGDLEDISTAKAKRMTIRIKVPLGRTKEELTATLERAAREVQEKTKANAVSVFAYRPQDKTDGAYSAGMAEYAPNGEWANAAQSGPMQVKVELNDLYFAAPTEKIDVQSVIQLKANSTDSKVGISRKYGSWMEEDIITYVPKGTEAKILEVKSQSLGSSELIRYQVSTDGGRVVGWIHEWNVK